MFSQFLCHLVGDYVLQSSWMANDKTKSWLPAAAHAFVYAVPFLFASMLNGMRVPYFDKTIETFHLAWPAYIILVLTHFLIDRYRLARYVCWAKNWIGPFWQVRLIEISPAQRYTGTPGVPGANDVLVPAKFKSVRIINNAWAECRATGYAADLAPWMAVWLLIITDNTIHLLINATAIFLFG